MHNFRRRFPLLGRGGEKASLWARRDCLAKGTPAQVLGMLSAVSSFPFHRHILAEACPGVVVHLAAREARSFWSEAEANGTKEIDF